MELMTKGLNKKLKNFPESWELIELVDLTYVLTKQTGFDYSAYIKPALVREPGASNLAFIQNKDFSGKRINYETDYYIPQNIALSFPKILLDEKCLLISISGSIGNVAVFDNKKMAFIGGAVAIAKFKNKDLLDWVMHYLQSPLGQNTIFKNVKAGSHHNLTLEDIRQIKVPLPPTSEQASISNALNDIDNLIRSLEKLISKKKAIKLGALQNLFKSKKSWKTVKLGEIVTVVGGGTPITSIDEYWNGTINWFTPTEIGNTKYVESSIRTITKKGLSESSAKLLPPGTILLTTRASIGDLAILKNEATTNQGFQSLIPNEHYFNEFIYYLMFTKKQELLKNASGSTFLEISPNKVKSIEVTVPNINEQKEIASILSDIDLEIKTLETKLDKYKQIKQGMMQNLLTGKIRLL